ncbi:MAG: hypothetical protein ACYC64_12025 [Armatimonadota bacterium]
MSDNKITSDSRTLPKRRWLNIGPGIVLALAISALLGARYIKTEMASRQQPSAPPIVERQVISSSYEEKSGPTPEVSFIIDRTEKIHLTDAQLVGLKALQSKWQKFYGPKIAQARLAAVKTDEYLAGTKSRSRTPIAQIQSEAGSLINLSGEISAARRSYWNHAVSCLTKKQRSILQQEREADWAARNGLFSSKTTSGSIKKNALFPKPL